jgi:exopolyphosphatase/guanosine-5'-triphosphate,3'-diphosphate pyrophosphatase
MKCASIDIGTNTVLLMIAELEEGIEEICDVATITRLGEGLKQTGRLSSLAMERTLDVLSHYRTLADENQADEILCVGTAALREAENSKVFLDLVSDVLSLSVRVISEHDEAFYTYLSVRQNLPEKAGNVTIVDIGGGSTEVICGTREDFIDFISLPLGSVKLSEMFIRNDPPSPGEVISLRDFIGSVLQFPFGKGNPFVVGTAGTVTNLGSISMGLSQWDKKKVHGLRLSAENIEAVIENLLAKPVAERRELPGMEKGREDIIPQGIILLQEIMRYLGARELVIDANGVRHGMLCERLDLLHNVA